MTDTAPAGWDLIGDLHGHATPLRALLSRWGYLPDMRGVHRHPAGRKVLFLGDYVDRGPEIPAVLRLVRGMVEAGQAVALMGNHEFNAVALEHRVDSRPLRPDSKRYQHADSLRQLAAAGEDHAEWLAWFRTLPLWHEQTGFRAVHACWDAAAIALLQGTLKEGWLRPDDWDRLAEPEAPLARAVELLLKGPEATLPGGRRLRDADGRERGEERVRWWAQPPPRSWREARVGHWADWAGEEAFPVEQMPGGFYPPGEKPVFFGHYALRGTPCWLAPNACCLDYGVMRRAALAGYRLTGEDARAGTFHAVTG